MNKFVFFLMLFSPIVSYSQMKSFYQECDTINIDDLYIVKDGERIMTDSNVKEDIEGFFSIVRVEPLVSNYCIIYLSRSDTLYTIYDSTINDESRIYRVDTSYSTKLYSVLVENKEEIRDSLIFWIYYYLSEEENKESTDVPIPLRLQRFYNVVQIPDVHKKKYDGFARTISCEQCQVIILHGKEELIYDCPLYNNLYRLK